MLGAFGFFMIGLIDDLVNRSPYLRLGLQAGIASLIWWAGIRIEFITLPGVGLVHLTWLSLPLTLL